MLETLLTADFLYPALTAIAVTATVVSLGLPLLDRQDLHEKMKNVALEREAIRKRERERLRKETTGANHTALLSKPNAFVKGLIEGLRLDHWLSSKTSSERLQMAGMRGPKAEAAYLLARLITPVVFLVLVVLYFGIYATELPSIWKLSAILVVTPLIGLKAPDFYLSNCIERRKKAMRGAFADSLDLLVICVDSGMSIEHGFRRVSEEIASASVPLAEEISILCAELSYLPQRRMAYENFAARTGLDVAKSLATALIQAESQGTSLGNALRVMAQETRDERMNLAEKKAASLSPKLTVPMITFFLPALMIIIMMPALIQVFEMK
jgi:tight adherence protein C